jgi:RimJ/RimL family protein N-acetyltransferase
MILVENIPLDTEVIKRLISDPEDLYLVWPKAKYPFDHEQWRQALDPEAGNVPFLVYDGEDLIGQASLVKTIEEQVYILGCLYLVPQCRSQGLGEVMTNLLEQYAREHLNAKKLILVVRSYNPRALRCYVKCGFIEMSREDTLIKMEKILQLD